MPLGAALFDRPNGPRAKRIALAGLLIGLFLGHAAGNETTEKIIGLSEAKRNELWTLYLQQSGRQCDAAVRSMFQGSSDDEDSWSVACSDGSSYAIQIFPGPEGATTLMSCDELMATDAVLLKLSRSRSSTAGCWKRVTH